MGQNRPPSVGPVIPTSGFIGHGTERVFTTAFSDPDGSGNIESVLFLINDRLTPAGAFYAQYKLNQDEVSLISDLGTVGPVTRGTPGVVLENSYVRLDIARMTVSGSGNQLIITWPITFKAPFGAKSCKAWLFVRDDLGLKDGWWARGGPYYVGAYAAQLREVATAANTERGPASHMPGSGGRADIAVPPTIPVVSDIRVRLPLVSK